MSALTHFYSPSAVTCMGYASSRSRRCRTLYGVRRRLGAFHAASNTPCHLLTLPVTSGVRMRKRELPTACTGFLVVGSIILCPACGRPRGSGLTGRILYRTFPACRIMNVSYHTLVGRRKSLRYIAVRCPAKIVGWWVGM